jgi:hypothetical protein
VLTDGATAISATAPAIDRNTCRDFMSPLPILILPGV